MSATSSKRWADNAINIVINFLGPQNGRRMNMQQYAGGTQQQQFHHEVGPILQQFAAKFTTSANEGTPANSGLVVMDSDSVRYHCSSNPPSQHFTNQPNSHVMNKHSPMVSHAQSNSFSNSTQENQLETSNNHCYSQNASTMQKADASTMTEKETQTPNESFINQLIQQECNKSQLSHYQVPSMVPPHAWQSLAAPPGSTVAEYLSRLPASTLPYTLHHFLKFSAPDSYPAVKKEEGLPVKKKKKRKYKKKPYIPKPPRPKPGEIRLTTALDGSTLYCCPECQMAYPEKTLLEEHLVVHRLERRFVCDICGAGLKRKEHLDRHKQGHNPQRPFVCSVCMKAFKRNEHLSRHFIIHSGDKSQVCMECGKAFFRKDHLRKHSQSHIAKRLRSELISQKAPQPPVQQNLATLASMVTMGPSGPPPGVTAVALMPGGTTVPILSS